MNKSDKKKALDIVTACNEFAINNSNEKIIINVENEGGKRLWFSVRHDERLVDIFGNDDYKYSMQMISLDDVFSIKKTEMAIQKIKFYIHQQKRIEKNGKQ